MIYFREAGPAYEPNPQENVDEDPRQHIDQSPNADKEEEDRKCWLTEAYEIKGPCQPCNEYRMVRDSPLFLNM